jgi:hypothetical protein
VSASRIFKELKKQFGDTGTKKTPAQKRTEAATKGQRTYREGVKKSGVTGGVAGATVASGAGSLVNEKSKESVAKEKESKGKGTGNDTRAKAADFPTYKKGTASSKAFNEAFKKAKDADKKTFTFEGRSYKVADKKEMAKGGAVKKMMYGGMSVKGKK